MRVACRILFRREWQRSPNGLLMTPPRASGKPRGASYIAAFGFATFGRNAQSAQMVSATSACGWIGVSTSPNLLPLTTAASILFAAAVGVCVALSQLVLAVGVTVLVLVTLRGLGFVEHWLGQREND